MNARCLLLAVGLLMIVAAPFATAEAPQASNAPTPYPDAADEAAWPGEGPIRVFPWMVDNRAFYWTRRQTDQDKIVFVGDSLVGNWKTLKDAFPGRKVANRGIGGDVSRGVLFRFQEDVLDLNPTAVVLCIGTNDLSAHADPDAVESNLIAIIEQARGHKADLPIIVCTVPPRDAAVAPMRPGAFDAVNERILKLGEGREGVTVLDITTPMTGDDGKPKAEFFNEDRLHVSAAGYAKWAELLAPVLDQVAPK